MANQPNGFRRIKKTEGSLFRRIFIFCMVSAVLGCGIWLLVPGKAPAAKPETAPEALETPETPETQLQGSPETGTLPETPSAAGEETAPSEEGTASLEVEEKTSEASEEGVSGPLSEEKTPEDLPVEKGVPHPTDPADDEPYQAPDILEQGGFSENLEAIRALLAQGNTALAETRLLSLIAETAFSSPEYRQAARVLNELHAKAPASGERPAETVYVVRSGDSLIRLARKYHVSAAQLAGANGLAADAKLRIGQKLRIPAGDPWNIRVSKRARLLCLFRAGKLYSVYDIGIGRRNLTPEGKFTVREVVDDPPYPKPGVGMIPAGSPENPLGACWIGLADYSGKATGYGIHGTQDEHSVTRNLSSGCIRMRNMEVKILRELLPLGTPVVIEP